MNQETAQRETGKRGWIRRMLTAVGRRCFALFCVYETGMSPAETQMFLSESGFYGDSIINARVGQSLARMKWE